MDLDVFFTSFLLSLRFAGFLVERSGLPTRTMVGAGRFSAEFNLF